MELFFNKVDLLKTLLQKIACIYENYRKKRSNEGSKLILGLIFHPMYGTIDIVKMHSAANSEELIPDSIDRSVFRVFLKPKSQKKQKKELARYETISKTLGISNNEMQTIYSGPNEDLFLNTQNNMGIHSDK